MTRPVESLLDLPAGRFRALTWGDGPETVLFLHGLTGVAEVWGPTIDELASGRRYVAIDQRGHGQSPHLPGRYGAHHMVVDTVAAIRRLGAGVHLVGHSMGARVALITAARHPELLLSAAIVDIGPEASKSNIEATTRGVSSRPGRFDGREAALAFAFRNRVPTEAEIEIFLARLDGHADGSFSWRSPTEALVECVTSQRGRSYWKDWRRIQGTCLFIHGGASTEVSVAIADKMVEENQRVHFERFEGIGHNIPLIAPARLAALLVRHWSSATNTAR